jgi:hypothetical protein
MIMVLAPLACLRFCELQRALVQQQPSWLEEMARLHALSLDQRQAQQSHQHADGHDMPLSHVKDLLTGVTEFVPAEGGPSIAILALLWAFAMLLRCTDTGCDPPVRLCACGALRGHSLLPVVCTRKHV